MGLSEKLALKRAAKEQKRAERQLVKAGKTGEQIIASLNKDRSPINLEGIAKTAELFNPSQKSEVIEKLLDKAHYKAMYATVKEQLEGDWMDDFKKLLKAVPAVKGMQAQVISWKSWQEYGLAAGLDEKGLVQALQVILIFRKAGDMNKLAKPGQKKTRQGKMVASHSKSGEDASESEG